MTTAARILLVEDERIIALEMKVFLQRLGYQVAASLATGEQALADAPAIRPDLVLMDIMLAGDLDGIETARRLRAVLPVPVVYCTAYTDPETMRRAQDTRPAGILTKPVNLDDLRRTIDQGLGRG